jgi:hypothetical protein
MSSDMTTMRVKAEARTGNQVSPNSLKEWQGPPEVNVLCERAWHLSTFWNHTLADSEGYQDGRETGKNQGMLTREARAGPAK